MGDAVAQTTWLARVLGIGVAQAPAAVQAAAPPQALSLVALGKARLGWGQVRGQAVSDIAALQAALAEAFAHDAAQQAVLKAALDRVAGLADQLDAVLEERLDALLNAAPEARPPARAAAVAALRNGIAFVTTDPLMTCIDGNEVLPDLRIAAPLRAGLAAIAAALK